jgi:hypothetical protein
MTDLRPPTGLTYNPKISSFLNIQFDNFKKPIGRTVLGDKNDYNGIKYKKNLQKIK